MRPPPALGLLLLLPHAEALASRRDGRRVLLFAYFEGSRDGLRLASSWDGRHFQALNGDRPVFRPPSWEGQGSLRDPSIVFHKGTFHLVWTTGWMGKIFGYANSTDLVTWSEPAAVQPFPESLAPLDQPLNVWAPEVHYDAERDDLFVLFSSTTPRQLRLRNASTAAAAAAAPGAPAQEGGGEEPGETLDHRTYIVRGTGGRFSPARLFLDPGFSVIDPVMKRSGKGWVMVLKQEERGQRNLRLAFAADKDLEEPFPPSFALVPEPVQGHAAKLRAKEPVEGPSLVSYGSRWLLYSDAFTKGHYSLISSRDLRTWRDETRHLVMPPGLHHGTAFTAPARSVGWL